MINYMDWDEISEETIKQIIAAATEAGPTASLDLEYCQQVLSAGQTYKLAGLTPIYVANNITARIQVYAEELVGYRYH
jgi:hypothetical protein